VSRIEESNRPARPFRVLAYALLALAVSSMAFSWRVLPPEASIPLVLLALAAVLSENYALALPSYTVSLAYPLTVSAVLLAGPTSAACVAALTAVSIADFRAKTAPSAMFFNLAQLVLVTLAAGWSYLALGGRTLLTAGLGSGQPLSYGDFPEILLPLVVVALVCTFGNDVILALGLTVLRKQTLRSSLSQLTWAIPSQLALAFVGYLIAQALAISLLALPLFAAPLLVARMLYQRYATLKEAYADTVRSLIGALEAKDPYTAGHSERVARYALKLGAATGLDSRTLERLEYAALLHDLGKLAVPGRLLTKPGCLSDEEMASVRLHAVRGAEMVTKIPPLKDLAEYVGNHHEWYDGGGYPLKVKAPAIPQLALILCVADSYDAMTTTRSYRPALTHDQAVAQLIGGAGSQFDPDLVRAFIEGRVGATLHEDEELVEIPASAVPTPAQGGGV
jgi:HD-GYP domain-containing protein (c-di-GMP phosphodiesterase class II)